MIGQILKEIYGIKEDDIVNALRIQKELGGYIGQTLIQTGVINETQLVDALSRQLNLPILSNEEREIDVPGINSFLNGKADIGFLIKNGFIPVAVTPESNTLSLAATDPLNTSITDYVVKAVSCRIRLHLAGEQTLKRLAKLYMIDEGRDFVSLDITGDTERLKEMAFEAPVIKFLNNLVSRAVELRGSDIHIEPLEKRYRVRFRIDGILHDMDLLDDTFSLAVVSRIKLLSGLDIAEKRLPLDGKFTTRIASAVLDIRVSTIPMITGEGVVLRLLYRERLTFDIGKTGIEADHAEVLSELISRPYGMLLVTGPTGSGKTTTLYSVLSSINKGDRKIITIEDPVEYQLPGINQIQVKSEIGLTFAHSLRSILRHDPDVILIGEIRDRETAKIAIESALTGHLVFSTLHTNDAPSSLFRLVEMEVEDYLINSAVIGVVAQRIIRKNCTHCSAPDNISEEVLKEYRLYETFERFKHLVNGVTNFRRGKGCTKCAGTGYKGRIAIFELFDYTEDLKETFLKDKTVESLNRLLCSKAYFRSLREDGMLKVLKGMTTIEEVLRVS